MGKNKIPIWDRIPDYLPELDFISGNLLGISDRDYQLRVWYRHEGPEVDDWAETGLRYEDEIRWFKQIVRDGTIQLNCDQIKAILRVHAMINCFDRILLHDRNPPRGHKENLLYTIDHPYWEKIRRQAQYALSLIRKT